MEDMLLWRSKFTSCVYSTKLLNKLEQLNKVNNTKINIDYIIKAIFYAKKYHGTQLRKSGEPYYSHPLEVAYLVADYIHDTNSLIISILHDVIEDTDLTPKMLAYIFNPTVASGVVDLTRIKESKKISACETVISLWNNKNYDLLTIKLCDRLHNMRTLAAKSSESIKRISKETLVSFIPLAMTLELPDVELELSNLCIYYSKQYADATGISQI